LKFVGDWDKGTARGASWTKHDGPPAKPIRHAGLVVEVIAGGLCDQLSFFYFLKTHWARRPIGLVVLETFYHWHPRVSMKETLHSVAF
jgi:hypothetical protein